MWLAQPFASTPNSCKVGRIRQAKRLSKSHWAQNRPDNRGLDARLTRRSIRAPFMPFHDKKLGLIAGNGKFPFLVLDAARAAGYEVVVIGIKEETFPEIESRGAVHWLSLGELSKLIDTLKGEGVSRAVMAGQVKHKQIFSSIRPDWRLAKVLLALTTRNTDSLIGAVAKVLADEGITLENSTGCWSLCWRKPECLRNGFLQSKSAGISSTGVPSLASRAARYRTDRSDCGIGVCSCGSHGRNRRDYSARREIMRSLVARHRRSIVRLPW